MTVYTLIDREELAQIVEDYALGKLLVTNGVARGSINTHYLLNTARGRFLLKIDEVKSELEVKREIDLLLFLRKHAFPVPAAAP